MKLKYNWTAAGQLRNWGVEVSQDLGQSRGTAFTYAVTLGLSPDQQAELEKRFGWDPELFAFLARAHEEFERLSETQAQPPYRPEA